MIKKNKLKTLKALEIRLVNKHQNLKYKAVKRKYVKRINKVRANIRYYEVKIKARKPRSYGRRKKPLNKIITERYKKMLIKLQNKQFGRGVKLTDELAHVFWKNSIIGTNIASRQNWNKNGTGFLIKEVFNPHSGNDISILKDLTDPTDIKEEIKRGMKRLVKYRSFTDEELDKKINNLTSLHADADIRYNGKKHKWEKRNPETGVWEETDDNGSWT